MSRHITATQARKIFFRLLQDADHPGASITITINGLPKVVMMSAEEFDGLVETLDILSDPEAVKGIEEGLRDAAAGRTVSLEEVERKFLGTPREKKQKRQRRNRQ